LEKALEYYSRVIAPTDHLDALLQRMDAKQ
jgi:hypothetical protein